MSAYNFIDDKLNISSDAIAAYNQGLPFDVLDGLVTDDNTTAPAYYQNGIPFTSSGAVALDTISAVASHVNGVPITANGRIAVDDVNAPDSFSNGLPFYNGRLAVVYGNSPWYSRAAVLLNDVAPSYFSDFANNRYYDSVNGVRSFPYGTVRNSAALMFNSAGQLVWNPHNLIPNSTMQGANVGVLPTGWISAGGGGLTTGVVGTGTTEQGNPYIDFRISGTSTGASFPLVQFHGNTAMPGRQGQSCTGSVSLSFVGTPILPVPTNLQIGDLDAGGGFLAASNIAVSPTAVTQRFTQTRVSSNFSTANQRFLVTWTLSAGQVIDVTLRISAPQFEYTDASSPRAYNPTSGSAYYGPRFDYDPITLEPQGLLIEPERINIIPNSFSLANLTGVTTSTGEVLGGFWATTRTTANGLSASHFAAGQPYTPSANELRHVYVVLKPQSGETRCQLAVTANSALGDVYANFNIVTGAVLAAGAGALNAITYPMGGGFYYVGFDFTTSATISGGGAAAIVGFIQSDSEARLGLNTSAGVIDIAFMGNLAGHGAVMPIPSYTAAVTRTADNVVEALGSWFNPSLGTLYVEAERRYVAAGSGVSGTFVQISDSTNNNRLAMVTGSGTNSQHRFDVISGGVAQAQLQTSVGSTPFKVRKIAAEYQLNNFTAVENAGIAGTDVSGTIPAGLTTLNIGRADTGAQINGWIREFRYYPDNSASVDQLQQLTVFNPSSLVAYTINMATGATSTNPEGGTTTDPFAAGWISVTAPTERLFPNAAGVYQSYSAGTAARNNAGLWHRENTRLNLIKNNSMAGAGAGVIPTTWTLVTGAPAGITATVAAAGASDPALGLPYIDISFSGTATATGTYALQFGANADNGCLELKTAVPAAGGSGYVVGETITLASTGGTQKVAATVRVTSVAAGAVTGVEIINRGSFSVNPTANPITQASTTGSGTGATFTVTYGLMVGLMQSGWLQLLSGTLNNTVNARLESIFTTSAGGASGAAQGLDDRLMNRDTAPRRHKRVVTAPVPGTAALVKPSLQVTLTTGNTYNFSLRLIAPQLEPVLSIGEDASHPILTTTVALLHEADTVRVNGGPLAYIASKKTTLELSTNKLTMNWRDCRANQSLLKVNGTIDMLRRDSNGKVQSAFSASASTYRTEKTQFGFTQTHACAIDGGNVEVASTAPLQKSGTVAGAIPALTSATITADGCITALKISNQKIALDSYASSSDNVVIYGATSGGIVNAADAIENGATARVFMRFREVIPGGMSSGGLVRVDASDISNFKAKAIDMLYYAGEIRGSTGSPTSTADPVAKYALRYFDYLIDKYQIRVHPTRPADYMVGGISSVAKNGGTKRITSMTTVSGQVATGDYFVDASYEGDLMEKAGISYITGREAKDTTLDANGAAKDPHNGNIAAQGGSTDSSGYGLYQMYNGSNSTVANILNVDPWTTAGDSTSALLAGVQTTTAGTIGATDDGVQAYNFRMTVTNTASLRVPFPSTAPAGYNPANYEILGRWAKACADAGRTPLAWNGSKTTGTYGLGDLYIFNGIGGNNYYDINNGNGFSSDWIGSNHGADFQAITGSTASQYCEATNEERAIYWNALKNYQFGYWYYLQYDCLNEVAALTATPVSGGSGYAVNDRIVLNVAGTMLPVVARVTTVSSGAVTGAVIMGGVMTRGNAAPSNPLSQSSTSGSGTGATFNLTWGSRIPAQMNTDALLFGLANDHYLDACEEDPLNWNTELYLREGRRMVGVAKMLSSDVLPPIGSTPVISTNTFGVVSYAIDSHHVKRIAQNNAGTWRILNEGNVIVTRSGFNSYAPLPIESVLPQASECTNLINSFTASTSHMAFGALRMEMSHMSIGQAAGILLAQMSLGAKPDVQSFNYSTFRTQALAEGLYLPQTN